MDGKRRAIAVRRIREVVAAGACDLHLHTTASDGTTTPEVLVDEVIANGLRAFSVTDHDTLAALPAVEAALATKGPDAPILIPGVELSVDYEIRPGRKVEVHVLGYFPLGGIQAVQVWLQEQRQHRRARNRRMCEKLTALGMPITLAELEAEGAYLRDDPAGAALDPGESMVGRVQAANILVRKGYAADRNDAFARLLGVGRPAYAARVRPSLAAAIAFLAKHGGLSVLAHPHVYQWTGCASGLWGRTLSGVLHELAAAGLAGVEAFHGEASAAARAEVLAAGLAAGLLITAGSDYHGDNKRAAMFTAETDFSAGL